SLRVSRLAVWGSRCCLGVSQPPTAPGASAGCTLRCRTRQIRSIYVIVPICIERARRCVLRMPWSSMGASSPVIALDAGDGAAQADHQASASDSLATPGRRLRSGSPLVQPRPHGLRSWAGSIRHTELEPGRSRITYVFQFTARPRLLRWLLEPIMNVVFH